MTASILQSELSSLIQESKRKFPDVRTAAESSLAELKALNITSETQLAGDLLRRPAFVDPFVQACRTQSPKLVSSGVNGLQRLAASRAISRQRVQDVVQSFKEVLRSPTDVQLKVLQTLPSLLQLGSKDFAHDLLLAMLEICGNLQASKAPVVANTAAATFQQLTTSLFDRYEATWSNDGPESGSDHDKAPEGTEVHAPSVFHDLCALLKDERTKHLQIPSMASPFLLEVIENLLINYEAMFSENLDLVESCRTLLLPAVLSIFEGKSSFGPTVKALRMMYLILLRHFSTMPEESQEVLLAIRRCLEVDSNPMWKRSLCMEVVKMICLEPSLILRMYEEFDHPEETKGIIAGLMASFVRVAAEDPFLVGLGRQSTVPVRSEGNVNADSELLIDPSGVGGFIGAVASAAAGVTGISAERSTMKTPLMEQADKLTSPNIPSTYLYGLVLESLLAVAEGLSKFVMPLTVPPKAGRNQQPIERDEPNDEVEIEGDSKRERSTASGANKYHRLLNPLTLSGHPLKGSIEVCADFIKTCWPAFLAACSTYLNSALDSTYYHGLIRALQKMTQVAGVLELATPRDAFLTSLAKAAAPINAHGRSIRSVSSPVPEDDSARPQTPKSPTSRKSIDAGRPLLSVRNLLCARALLNLGIALGPSMNAEAWTIILETLQQVEVSSVITPMDTSINETIAKPVENGIEETRSTLGTELLAMRTATKRMLESTKSYSDGAFKTVVCALFQLIGTSPEESTEMTSKEPNTSASRNQEWQRKTHHKNRSMSGVFKTSQYREQEVHFVLQQTEILAMANIRRFAIAASSDASWDLIIPCLLHVLGQRTLDFKLRLRSAMSTDIIAMGAASLLHSDSKKANDIELLHSRCLLALRAQLSHIDAGEDEDLEIHKKLLDSLENVLGQIGDSLQASWEIALEILRQTFEDTPRQVSQTQSDSAMTDMVKPKSTSLTQSAFRSVQLTVSDFSRDLPLVTLGDLNNLLFLFGVQNVDMNISLTTVSLFLSIASLVAERVEELHWTNDLSDLVSAYEPVFQHRVETLPSLWLQTVLHLSVLCCDERENVRTTSIRVLFRAIEAGGSKLDGTVWAHVLQRSSVYTVRYYHSQIMQHNKNLPEWQRSVSQVLKTMSETVDAHSQTICTAQHFISFWRSYLEMCQSVLQQDSPAVWTSVYSSLTQLLQSLRQNNITNPEFGTSALKLWHSNHPSNLETAHHAPNTTGNEAASSNQDAFLQYSLLFIEAFHMLQTALTGQELFAHISLPASLKSLKTIVSQSRHPRYSSDIKKMSIEQEQVVVAFSLFENLLQENVEIMVDYLLDFIHAAIGRDSKPVFETARPDSKESQRPTFIAFSTECVQLLDKLITPAAPISELFKGSTITRSLNVLAVIIETKYSSLPHNEERSLWQCASVAAMNITKVMIQHVEASDSELASDKLEAFFGATNAVARAILDAPNLSPQLGELSTTQLSHETFDERTIKTLHQTLIPSLGLPDVPQATRQSYTQILFHASLVAEPLFLDFSPDLAHNPLQSLAKLRHGTVTPPQFFPRRHIPYTAIDTLFGLVAVRPQRGGSEDECHLTLARTAAPYVLLRLAHALKSYMADQPLRGLEPLPAPLQRELSDLLGRFVDLRVEDRAFVALVRRDGEIGAESRIGVVRDGKTHLRMLYPLLRRFRGSWRGTWRKGGWRGVAAGGGVGVQGDYRGKADAEGSQDGEESPVWQDGVMGRMIERAVERWEDEVTAGWGGGLMT